MLSRPLSRSSLPFSRPSYHFRSVLASGHAEISSDEISDDNWARTKERSINPDASEADQKALMSLFQSALTMHLDAKTQRIRIQPEDWEIYDHLSLPELWEFVKVHIQALMNLCRGQEKLPSPLLWVLGQLRREQAALHISDPVPVPPEEEVFERRDAACRKLAGCLPEAWDKKQKLVCKRLEFKADEDPLQQAAIEEARRAFERYGAFLDRDLNQAETAGNKDCVLNHTMMHYPSVTVENNAFYTYKRRVLDQLADCLRREGTTFTVERLPKQYPEDVRREAVVAHFAVV